MDMDDITTIKQKTFELKQYAGAIMNDIDNKLAEERKRYKDSIDEAVDCKDKRIDKLEGTLLAKEDEIEEVKNENAKLETAIKNMKSVIESALEICEGAE